MSRMSRAGAFAVLSCLTRAAAVSHARAAAGNAASHRQEALQLALCARVMGAAANSTCRTLAHGMACWSSWLRHGASAMQVPHGSWGARGDDECAGLPISACPCRSRGHVVRLRPGGRKGGAPNARAALRSRLFHGMPARRAVAVFVDCSSGQLEWRVRVGGPRRRIDMQGTAAGDRNTPSEFWLTDRSQAPIGFAGWGGLPAHSIIRVCLPRTARAPGDGRGRCAGGPCESTVRFGLDRAPCVVRHWRAGRRGAGGLTPTEKSDLAWTCATRRPVCWMAPPPRERHLRTGAGRNSLAQASVRSACRTGAVVLPEALALQIILLRVP